MYTRCPACHTVHAVSAGLLAAAAGRYRCAKCNKLGNALDCLFDEWPAAGEPPPQPGDFPVLGLPIDPEATARSREDPDAAETGLNREAPAGRRPGRLVLRATWISAAVVILGFSAFRFAEFLGQPLLTGVNLERTGLLRRQDNESFRDLDQVHLVSRELRSHPSQAGRLLLNVTIVNRADRNQPYPAIEVALLDSGGRTLSTQRFEPSDYLGADRAGGAGMTPQAYVPLTLGLDDPGEQAVGFELEFR
jgi:predicted Zn finger-like uncharacterized protein